MMSSFQRGFFFVSIFMLPIYHTTVWSQTLPLLDSLYPKGMQRAKYANNGEAVYPVNRITLYGKNLQDVSEVMLSGDGVESIQVAERATGNVSVDFSGSGVSGKVDEGHRLVVECRLSPEAEMYMRQIRVVTPNGVSNPLTVLVGDLNEIYEAEPNNTLEAPQEVNLPLTINAVISANDDVDVYRFAASKGQRIFCEVNASRIGSPLDSYIVLYDETGHEVASNDIANGLDSLIDYEVEHDGAYRLTIRDLRYKGNGGYFYRLSIGALPFLDSIFPLGGKRGSQSNLQVSGKNLGNINAIQFAVAPDAPLGTRNIRITPSSGNATNPLLFDVDDLPEFTETESNNAADNANAVNLPVVINGKMNEADDIDRFAFDAKKGQRFIIEVMAKRLGTKLDGFLELFDPNGNSIQINDDAVGVEARIDHTFAEDGRYQISLRDLSNLGGDDYAYRLKIQPLQRGLAASVNMDNPRITPGGSVPLQFNVSRQGGLSGAVRIELRGLPDGIEAGAGIVEPNQNGVLVTLNAAATVPPGLYKISAVACAADGGNVTVQPVSPGVIYLTVLNDAPYTLEVVDVLAGVDQMKSSQVRVKAHRRDGFAAPIRLQLTGNPEGMNSNNTTIGENQTDAVVNISADEDAQPGLYWISAKGEAAADNVTWEQYSATFPFEIREAPFTVDAQPRRIILPLSAPATNRDATMTEVVEITLSIDRKGYFTHQVEVVANNVPDKMSVPTVIAEPGMNEVKIKVSATLDAPPETYNISFTCRSEVNGKIYQQQSPGVSIKLIQSESFDEES